jgi:hypothetical protein
MSALADIEHLRTRVLMYVPPNVPAGPQTDAVEIVRNAGAVPGTISLTIKISDPPHPSDQTDLRGANLSKRAPWRGAPSC